MDSKVGQALKQLEEAGLLENTIVIHNSDHGGPFPRGKRYMFNSGTHCPLIIRIPEKYKHLWPAEKPGMTVDRLVSFVDMPATWLSLAGAEIPKEYQGCVFLGKNAAPEPKYHFSFRGRNDARLENSRAIRNKRFLFIKNYIPYVPWSQYLAYQWKIPTQRFWEAHHKAGKTDPVTGRFFNTKPVEELYDTNNDPYCIKNLINKPEFADIAKTLRTQLKSYQKKYFDAGLIPESEVVKRANDNNMTIYELVRKKELYDVDAYLAAADIALAGDSANLPKLIEMMKNKDSGIRYWGVVGCFFLKDKAASAKDSLIKALKDSSDNVRAMAGWTLINLSEKEKGLACLNDMMAADSYAMLEILNIVDWLGEDGKSLIPAVQKTSSKIRYADEMKDYLVNGRFEERKKE